MLKPPLRLAGFGVLLGLFVSAEPLLANPTSPPAQPTAYTPAVGALPLRLELNLTQRRVTLYQGDQAVKSYPVAVGKPGWETPTGDFKVAQMFQDPVWKNPFSGGVIPGGDPENPLGSRWIGFWTDGKNWVGFHGTPNLDSVGKAASHGCVRMYPKDVEELFAQVQVGTPVIVRK